MTDQPEQKKSLVVESEDVIAVVGLLILLAGIFWIYPPASVIVFGAVLLAYAYLSAKPKDDSGPR